MNTTSVETKERRRQSRSRGPLFASDTTNKFFPCGIKGMFVQKELLKVEETKQLHDRDLNVD
jgi:hypothetical protein